MEIIEFKFADLDDEIEENFEWFEDSDMIDLKEREEVAVTVRGYKIAFPKLGVFFREGLYYFADNEPESVYVEYGIDETDINNYESCVSYDLDFEIRERCKEKGMSDKEIDELNCYFEMDLPFEA